jgi:8-oxo-dGTP diphosphatase
VTRTLSLFEIGLGDGAPRRETREETGLEVVAEKAVGVYRQPHPAHAERNVQLVASVFLCRVVEGDLRPGQETAEVAYFDPRALPDGVVPAHARRIADALAVRDGADAGIG